MKIWQLEGCPPHLGTLKKVHLMSFVIVLMISNAIAIEIHLVLFGLIISTITQIVFAATWQNTLDFYPEPAMLPSNWWSWMKLTIGFLKPRPRPSKLQEEWEKWDLTHN